MQKDQPNLRWLFVFLLSFNHKIPKLGIKMEHVIQTSKTYKQESILDFQAVKKKTPFQISEDLKTNKDGKVLSSQNGGTKTYKLNKNTIFMY